MVTHSYPIGLPDLKFLYPNRNKTQTFSKYIQVYVREIVTGTSKQPIKTCYLGLVTGYQPIWDQYFMVRSVPGD